PGSFIDDLDRDVRRVTTEAHPDRCSRTVEVGVLDRIRTCLVAREHHLFARLVRERNLLEPPSYRRTKVGQGVGLGGYRDDEWRSLRCGAQAEDGHVMD